MAAAEERRSNRARSTIFRAAPLFALCAGGLPGSSAGGQTVGLSPISALHQSLRLTAQQEPAWKAYREEAAEPEKAQARRRAAAKMFPTLTAPQRLDLVEAELRQELLDLQRQSHALKAFYAALSPEQQRVFDKQTLPPRGSQAVGQ